MPASSAPPFEPERFRSVFLLLLVVGITVLFLVMIRQFLMPLLLAAILSGMVHPVQQRLANLLRGRARTAAVLTIVGVFLVIVIPLSALLGVIVSEAIGVTEAVRPWVEQQLTEPSGFDRLLARLPFAEELAPYSDQLLQRVGELVARTGTFLVDRLAATTRGTAVFVFLLFIMLYAMYFFLLDGRKVLDRILYYAPLSSVDENRMVEKFVSVSRATLKGTLVIGVVQGALAGLAFFVIGLDGAVFWGTIMAVLSIIPGVGTALVWVPAVVILIAGGRAVAAIGLAIWCGGLVGTVDNVLRPRLVGRDTKMPDLLILLGTLGGIVLFGAAGVLVGPIVAALFITVWDLYGTAFRELLPPVEPLPASVKPRVPEVAEAPPAEDVKP